MQNEKISEKPSSLFHYLLILVTVNIKIWKKINYFHNCRLAGSPDKLAFLKVKNSSVSKIDKASIINFVFQLIGYNECRGLSSDCSILPHSFLLPRSRNTGINDNFTSIEHFMIIFIWTPKQLFIIIQKLISNNLKQSSDISGNWRNCINRYTTTRGTRIIEFIYLGKYFYLLTDSHNPNHLEMLSHLTSVTSWGGGSIGSSYYFLYSTLPSTNL